jgi:iron complex transport system substrate-binding protein
VGVTVYCQRPPEAKVKEKVGTVIDVNIEKVIELSPNLVIASNLTDRKQIKKLQNLGIHVKVFSQTRDFHGLCENFLTLARLVGKEMKGDTIVKKAKAELGAMEASLQRFSRRRVFVQIGANPLFAASGESFIGDLIERAGGVNIASDAKEGIFSREEVISRNPDTILIVNMGIVGTREKEVWMRYKTVSAVENDRIFTVDSYRVCSPTPVSFVETVKEFVRIFHGEH